VIVFKDGKFYMAYSTPGGDMQPQALIQVFLNMHVFGMDLQEAISAPRFFTITAPNSFAPHQANPATLRLEADLFATTAPGLKALGYTTVEDPVWEMDFGGWERSWLGKTEPCMPVPTHAGRRLPVENNLIEAGQLQIELPLSETFACILHHKD
jgi:gamma-glutamyltranspeptidase